MCQTLSHLPIIQLLLELHHIQSLILSTAACETPPVPQLCPSLRKKCLSTPDPVRVAAKTTRHQLMLVVLHTAHMLLAYTQPEELQICHGSPAGDAHEAAPALLQQINVLMFYVQCHSLFLTYRKQNMPFCRLQACFANQITHAPTEKGKMLLELQEAASLSSTAGKTLFGLQYMRRVHY